ncbi:ACP S-malonyltransferase [Alicyclobacillus fodiniaquatilis]|uniref:[acyl-carrier-protein] S-malonyltransferase n=1 Tax=Alicyclobacillus fodiniaquatilis TaxID=1661150 RepID=A0ABW4JJ53_9BACL
MIAFLFPGQGSQFVGMGKTLFDKFSIAKDVFQEANDVLNMDFTSLCLVGDLDELTKTENAQPALLTVSMAAYRVYIKEFSIAPDFLAGHSLGEFTALACSGALSFADALTIVRRRGVLMQEAVANGLGVMTAVGEVERSVVETVCAEISTVSKPVTIGCYNAPKQLVISGHQEAVNRAEALLEAKGASITPLKVSASFHSPLMTSAAVQLREYLMNFTFGPMDVPVISNVTALPHENADKVIDLLTRQMTEPVRWQETMEYLKGRGVKHVIEMGSKQVLKKLVVKNLPGIRAYSLGEADELQNLKETFAILNHVPSFIGKCLATAVATKNRNTNHDEYQRGVIEPYNRIKQMLMELEQTNKQPTEEQKLAALDMLHSVFVTKQVPLAEREFRLQHLFRVTKTGNLMSQVGTGGRA